MNIFNNNTKIALLKEIADSFPEKYDVEETRSKYPTYNIDKVSIHSKYDPIKESQRTVSLINDEEIDVYIIFGSGLGYIVSELFKQAIINNPRKTKPHIIVIEKDTKSFVTSLYITDYNEIIASNNVRIFIDSEKNIIGSYLQKIPTQKIRYYYHRPLYILNIDYYKEVQNYISYVLDRKDMNTATMARFQKLWTRNTIYNLPYVPSTIPLNNLENKASSDTAVIVAGGPSLTTLIPQLKKYQSSLVIISVDTAYNYLVDNGIKPDIVVTIDPQYWNFKYLENQNLTDVLIVTDLTAYYQLFRNHKSGQIVTGQSLFNLSTHFYSDMSSRGNLAAGGSVSTTAFDTARILGCENIILAGLDLGFPNKNTHFKGAFFETGFISDSTYFKTVEQKSFAYISHAGLLQTKSTNGNMVYTDPKMILFKKWFEREIPLTKSKVYLPNSGGSLITGATIIEYDELELIFKKANKIYNNKIFSGKSVKNESFDVMSKKFISQCLIVKKKSEDLINILPKDGNVNQETIRKYENISDEILNSSTTHEAARIITASAQDILLSIMENIQYSDDETKSLWIKTRKLFEAMYDMSEIYINYFNKTVKFMNSKPKIYLDSL